MAVITVNRNEEDYYVFFDAESEEHIMTLSECQVIDLFVFKNRPPLGFQVHVCITKPRDPSTLIKVATGEGWHERKVKEYIGGYDYKTIDAKVWEERDFTEAFRNCEEDLKCTEVEADDIREILIVLLDGDDDFYCEENEHYEYYLKNKNLVGQSD